MSPCVRCQCPRGTRARAVDGRVGSRALPANPGANGQAVWEAVVHSRVCLHLRRLVPLVGSALRVVLPVRAASPGPLAYRCAVLHIPVMLRECPGPATQAHTQAPGYNGCNVTRCAVIAVHSMLPQLLHNCGQQLLYNCGTVHYGTYSTPLPYRKFAHRQRDSPIAILTARLSPPGLASPRARCQLPLGRLSVGDSLCWGKISVYPPF